jgi:hypothetical protein
MRKVEIRGYVIFNEERLNHGNNIIGQIDHELFNVDGVREWDLEEVSNVEYEYDPEEDEYED